jgi:transposase
MAMGGRGATHALAAVAVERAMKVQEVICRVLAGPLTWFQGADIPGIHARSLRRWCARYEREGVLGLYDGRRGQPSRRQAPVAEIQRILRLYRELRAARRAPRVQRAALLPPRPARSRRNPVLRRAHRGLAHA